MRRKPRSWLVTNMVSFIGGNLLVDPLLQLSQRMVVIENFASGHHHNLCNARNLVSPLQWARFDFI